MGKSAKAKQLAPVPCQDCGQPCSTKFFVPPTQRRNTVAYCGPCYSAYRKRVDSPALRKAGFIAGLAFALVTAISPSQGLCDQQASLGLANAAVSVLDAVQTCQFAPYGSRFDMHEQQSAWAIGKHPSCGVATAWTMGGAAAVLLLPHTPTFRLVVTGVAAFHSATVASNYRLMAQWRVK